MEMEGKSLSAEPLGAMGKEKLKCGLKVDLQLIPANGGNGEADSFYIGGTIRTAISCGST